MAVSHADWCLQANMAAPSGILPLTSKSIPAIYFAEYTTLYAQPTQPMSAPLRPIKSKGANRTYKRWVTMRMKRLNRTERRKRMDFDNLSLLRAHNYPARLFRFEVALECPDIGHMLDMAFAAINNFSSLVLDKIYLLADEFYHNLTNIPA